MVHTFFIYNIVFFLIIKNEFFFWFFLYALTLEYNIIGRYESI
jgi:hypothetical protein